VWNVDESRWGVVEQGVERIEKGRGQDKERGGSRRRDREFGRGEHPCGWVVGGEKGHVILGGFGVEGSTFGDEDGALPGDTVVG